GFAPSLRFGTKDRATSPGRALQSGDRRERGPNHRSLAKYSRTESLRTAGQPSIYSTHPIFIFFSRDCLGSAQSADLLRLHPCPLPLLAGSESVRGSRVPLGDAFPAAVPLPRSRTAIRADPSLL